MRVGVSGQQQGVLGVPDLFTVVVGPESPPTPTCS
jgi:hypothetical protein